MSEDIPPKETTQEENNNHEENQNVAEEVATSQQPAPAPAPAPAEEEELETEKLNQLKKIKRNYHIKKQTYQRWVMTWFKRIHILRFYNLLPINNNLLHHLKICQH